ncbi:MAG: hypothetical protein A2901_05775 [Elusimicrobia bacterium RIFCSPLOWO2_01_FULL_54_10]|nr:MAG: hypothetical protein A2901_05775 [Elusimicrobia bacterium RIFCSPLOWO2_01_FULL_54_10]
MKRSFLEILACPDCGSPFEVSVLREEQHRVNEIWEGLLVCGRCVKSHAIVDGIPRFVPNAPLLFPEFFQKYPEAAKVIPGAGEADFLKVHGKTQERFGMEWMKYPGPLHEDREVFLAETQIHASDWEGRLVLDGGCGMGRYSRVAHNLGGTMVALDLSPALARLQDLAKESERMHLVQGNLMRPPLRAEIFDIVYSVGVIHHTPSAKYTFSQLARLVKPKGLLSVWVYGAPGTFQNFKTNPLRSDRQGLKKFIFLVWLTVWLREKISDALRVVTVKMPHNLLYSLCCPLAALGKVPFLQYFTFSVHPIWRVRLQENFDWLTPPYQSHHTKEELREWFEQNGIEPLKVLPHGVVPKPGILGKKK